MKAVREEVVKLREVGFAENVFGAQRTAQGNTELILTVKMETRHSVWGQFGREFSVFVIDVEF